MSSRDDFTSTVDAAAAHERRRAQAEGEDYDPADDDTPTPGELAVEANDWSRWHTNLTRKANQ